MAETRETTGTEGYVTIKDQNYRTTEFHWLGRNRNSMGLPFWYVRYLQMWRKGETEINTKICQADFVSEQSVWSCLPAVGTPVFWHTEWVLFNLALDDLSFYLTMPSF